MPDDDEDALGDRIVHLHAEHPQVRSIIAKHAPTLHLVLAAHEAARLVPLAVVALVAGAVAAISTGGVVRWLGVCGVAIGAYLLGVAWLRRRALRRLG